MASLSTFSSFLPSPALFLLLFPLPLLLFLLFLLTHDSTDDEPAAGSRSSRLLRVHRFTLVEIVDSMLCLQGVWDVFFQAGSAQVPAGRHDLGVAPHAFYPTLVTGSPSHSAPRRVAIRTLGLGRSSHTVLVPL